MADKTIQSTIQDTIDDDYKTAFKAKEKKKYIALRPVLAKIKQVTIDTRKELTNDEILQILRTEVKGRKEVMEQFKTGGRQDLVDLTKYEIEVIEHYLPAQMSDEDLEKIVQETIEQTGASSPSDMGKVMGVAMGKVKGLADGGRVKEMAQKLLA